MNLINKLLLTLLIIGLPGTLGCAYSSSYNSELALEAENADMETADSTIQIKTAIVNITTENQTYQAYTAAPAAEGSYPAIVLIHSFKGFEHGYQKMVDKMATDGYVVVAPFWQTYSQSPSDAEVGSLVKGSLDYLEERKDVNSGKIGLTGFCAGGRYTMLFLPQMKNFKSGVAWYGFPYTGSTDVQPEKPANLIVQLDAPMLMIHGSQDQISNVSSIYKYAGELDAADKYYELKVYQGEPHGFMITERGELSESFVAQDAYKEMIGFFDRTLKISYQMSKEPQ